MFLISLLLIFHSQHPYVKIGRHCICTICNTTSSDILLHLLIIQLKKAQNLRRRSSIEELKYVTITKHNAQI